MHDGMLTKRREDKHGRQDDARKPGRVRRRVITNRRKQKVQRREITRRGRRDIGHVRVDTVRIGDPVKDTTTLGAFVIVPRPFQDAREAMRMNWGPDRQTDRKNTNTSKKKKK